MGLPFIVPHSATTVSHLCHPACRNEISSFSYRVPSVHSVFFCPNTIGVSPAHTSANPSRFPGTSQKPLPPPETDGGSNYEEICTGDGRLSQVPWKFHLINLGQKLAALASRHSSRLPEVDPIFCLNRH